LRDGTGALRQACNELAGVTVAVEAQAFIEQLVENSPLIENDDAVGNALE
jgi:hypothetical protein